ncbi:MAG: hypothetical protein GF388_02645 [Candidatus Aegiribacteria sp.]|nr:hypothetical protein [Candidatus Aegiribacteria sp.]
MHKRITLKGHRLLSSYTNAKDQPPVGQFQFDPFRRFVGSSFNSGSSGSESVGTGPGGAALNGIIGSGDSFGGVETLSCQFKPVTVSGIDVFALLCSDTGLETWCFN